MLCRQTAGEQVSRAEQSKAQILSIVLHSHFTQTCLFNCMITNLSSLFLKLDIVQRGNYNKIKTRGEFLVPSV